MPEGRGGLAQSRARAWCLAAALVAGAPAVQAGQLYSATWPQQVFDTSFSHTALSTSFGVGSFEVSGVSYLVGGVTSISVALELPGFVATAFVPPTRPSRCRCSSASPTRARRP
jgi:hypothetical protein